VKILAVALVAQLFVKIHTITCLKYRLFVVS